MNVHFFSSTGEAYDQSQYRSDIKDGDLLVSGWTVAILVKAWPTFVKGPKAGAFHVYLEGATFPPEYAESVAAAEAFDNSKARITYNGANGEVIAYFTEAEARDEFTRLKAKREAANPNDRYKMTDAERAADYEEFNRAFALRAPLDIGMDSYGNDVENDNRY